MKRILAVLLAACLAWGCALAEPFDGFSLELPELAEAEYQEKADGAYLFSGAADLGGGAPVILACRWFEQLPEQTPEAVLEEIDADARSQGFSVAESELMRSEAAEDGAQICLVRQQLVMRIGVGKLETPMYTGRMAFDRGAAGAYVFTVTSTEPETAEAGLQLFAAVEWAD